MRSRVSRGKKARENRIVPDLSYFMVTPTGGVLAVHVLVWETGGVKHVTFDSENFTFET